MENIVLKIENLSAGYKGNLVLKNINLEIERNKVTSIMGPSGCGKSTLIRCINRMHELTPGAFLKGKIYLDGENIFSMHPSVLRRKVGMVFQRPNPFPTMSIYDNVIAGYILNGIKLKKEEKDRIVEESLKKAFLWEEVKDNLYKKGVFLSGGQQQRLCIARALAMNPEIILLDEPTSSLDPKATSMIEELIIELKKTVTVVLVTHNRSQAARVSDYTAFLYLGELVEFDKTPKMFTTPKDKRTEEYLTGKFG
ncbi:MAG: phosphate ABC transporter ATP-binding protein [Candidatus Atribacteria bacterium]|nr:phosphate ABC transporter ATP-binding protein [Candidatus Atribacteria bacterium]MCD6350338.1 phosphate ABC transporter ATP-binding protein [Candidatus Atribacteria bacterium]